MRDLTRPGNSKFGPWLYDWRTGQHLSQEELAQAIGSTERTIGRYEQGGSRPRRGPLQRLVAAIGLPDDEIEAFISWAQEGPTPATLTLPDVSPAARRVQQIRAEKRRQGATQQAAPEVPPSEASAPQGEPFESIGEEGQPRHPAGRRTRPGLAWMLGAAALILAIGVAAWLSGMRGGSGIARPTPTLVGPFLEPRTDAEARALLVNPIYYIDVGNPVAEKPFGLADWGFTDGPGDHIIPGPDHDRTRRFLLLHSAASLALPAVSADRDYRLAFAVERGECDDSFAVAVGDSRVVLGYVDAARLPQYQVRVYVAPVPRGAVRAGVLIAFFIDAARDDCKGRSTRSGIYGVWLLPGASGTP